MKHKKTQNEIVAKRLKIEANQMKKVEKVTTSFVIPKFVTKIQMCSVAEPKDFKKLHSTPLGVSFAKWFPNTFRDYIIAHKSIFNESITFLSTLVDNIKSRLEQTERNSYNLWESNLWIFQMEQCNPNLPLWSLCLFSIPEDFSYLMEQPNIIKNFISDEQMKFKDFIISKIQHDPKWDHLFLDIFSKLKKRFIKKLAQDYIRKQSNHSLAMKAAYMQMKFKIPISTGLIIENIKSNSIICNNGIEYKLDNPNVHYNTPYFVFTKSNWNLERDFLPVVTIHKHTSEIVELLMKKMKPDMIGNVILFSGLCDLKTSPNFKRRQYCTAYKHVQDELLINYIAPYLFRVNTKQESLNCDVLRDFFKMVL